MDDCCRFSAEAFWWRSRPGWRFCRWVSRDREWYSTFEEYRFRLLEHTGLLLGLLRSEKKYKTFHMDGQVAPLVDHLEVRPDDAAKLKRAVSSGKIGRLINRCHCAVATGKSSAVQPNVSW